MKKLFSSFLSVILMIGLSACAVPTGQLSEDPGISHTGTPEGSEAVVFADPVLEALIRAVMGRPDGVITKADATSVTDINLSRERLQYISGRKAVTDISGLESFINLETLDLSYHEITDIAPLAGLGKLIFLSLAGNPLTDVTLLNSMPGIRHLYLAGSGVSDFSVLADIYPTLEKKDFKLSSLLEDLGIIKKDDSVLAEYTGDGFDITINHSRWGIPQMDMEANSIRMYLKPGNGYNMTIGYHPEVKAFVFRVEKEDGGAAFDFVYEYEKGESAFSPSDKEKIEGILRDALGETAGDDALDAAVTTFHEKIQQTFNMTADALYALPYDQNDEELPDGQPSLTPSFGSEYVQLGFMPDESRAICVFEKSDPHFIKISVHKPEWGENPDGWDMEFHDSDVNGYSLVIQYFEEEDKYHFTLDMNGKHCSFDGYPATDRYGWEYPDLDTVIFMLGDAFESSGKEIYYKPQELFERTVGKLFGMSVSELFGK